MNNTVDIKVVVEGELDAKILRAILDKAVAGRIRFFAAGPAFRFFESPRSLQPARQVNWCVRRYATDVS